MGLHKHYGKEVYEWMELYMYIRTSRRENICNQYKTVILHLLLNCTHIHLKGRKFSSAENAKLVVYSTTKSNFPLMG
jgi:hypothetical protein